MPVVRLELHIAFEDILVWWQVMYSYVHISVTRGLDNVIEIALRSSLWELHFCVILAMGRWCCWSHGHTWAVAVASTITLLLLASYDGSHWPQGIRVIFKMSYVIDTNSFNPMTWFLWWQWLKQNFRWFVWWIEHICQLHYCYISSSRGETKALEIDLWSSLWELQAITIVGEMICCSCLGWAWKAACCTSASLLYSGN